MHSILSYLNKLMPHKNQTCAKMEKEKCKVRFFIDQPSLKNYNIVGKMILVTMGFERKTSGYKTKALASTKRVPQLFSAIVSSYVVVFQDGACHISMPPVRTLIVQEVFMHS